jgi:hypothetical protein
VRGDLGVLLGAAGDYGQAVDLRLGNDIAGRELEDDDPEPATVFFYLSLLKMQSSLTTLSLHPIRSTIALMISTLFRTLLSVLATQCKLALENLALRQQIVVLQCSVKRPRLKKTDRVFWVLLSKIWDDWANTLTLVKPDTVVRWHRKGFRLYWT